MEPESQPVQSPDGPEPVEASVVADRAETSDWAEPTETSSGSQAASWCDLISGIFILAALIFGGVGLYTMYDNSYSSESWAATHTISSYTPRAELLSFAPVSFARC
jgi:hypothetical protein